MTAATLWQSSAGPYDFVHQAAAGSSPYPPMRPPLPGLAPAGDFLAGRSGPSLARHPAGSGVGPAETADSMTVRVRQACSGGPDNTPPADRSAQTGDASTAGQQTGPDGAAQVAEPRPQRTRRPISSWPLLLLAAPAGVATWSGWVGLGQATGFGTVKPLPGLWEDLTVNTAITLPIGVEAYAAFALNAWLSHRPLSSTTRGFAAVSALGSLVLGAAGQVAYHLLEVSRAAAIEAADTPAARAAAEAAHAHWLITTLVSCLPVLVLGMGAALSHLLRRDAHAAPIEADRPRDTGDAADQQPDPRTERDRTGTGPQTTKAGGGSRDRTGPPVRPPAGGDAPGRLATDSRRRGHGTDGQGGAGLRPVRTAVDDRAQTATRSGTHRPRTGRRTGNTRPRDGVVLVSADKLEAAREAAQRLGEKDVPLSRNSLRGAGIRGENAVLAEIVRILNAERAGQPEPVAADV